jgi:glutathione S-transferase
VDNGALVTELGACFIYLADAFPQKGLAPLIGDPLRGPYIRWLVFYGSSFEPAVMDRHMKREPGPQGQSAYGDFDAVMALINAQLENGPYLLGDRFTAADILWSAALRWTMTFGIVPPTARISDYVERIGERASVKRVAETDAELAKVHEAVAARA